MNPRLLGKIYTDGINTLLATGFSVSGFFKKKDCIILGGLLHVPIDEFLRDWREI